MTVLEELMSMSQTTSNQLRALVTECESAEQEYSAAVKSLPASQSGTQESGGTYNDDNVDITFRNRDGNQGCAVQKDGAHAMSRTEVAASNYPSRSERCGWYYY